MQAHARAQYMKLNIYSWASKIPPSMPPPSQDKAYSRPISTFFCDGGDLEAGTLEVHDLPQITDSCKVGQLKPENAGDHGNATKLGTWLRMTPELEPTLGCQFNVSIGSMFSMFQCFNV